MGIVFKNNAKTTLASSLSNSATSATVTDGSVFPSLSAGEFFLITFDDGSNNEICKCTARSGNTLTIVRAQESTTARAFSSGDAAEGRVTAGVLEQIQENIASKSANQTVFNATTAGGATTYNIGTNPGVEANAMVFLNGVLQHHDTLSFSGTNLTFDAAPPNGMALEVIIDNLINLQSSNLTVDSFTAADVSGNPQTAFTLSDDPAAETNLIVFVDGVFQDQDSYTISSNTLTITDGVIAGRGVTVYVINPVNIGTPSDSTVTSAKLSGNITMPGNLIVGSNDVSFDSPTFVVDNANSRVGLGTASPSVPVDIVGEVKTSSHINIGGNLVKASGDLTLDVAGEIRLSADDNGEVHFYDGSLHYGSILEDNSNLIIQSIVQDEDILFKGNDGSSVITALTLDMSKAGEATFNNNVIANASGGVATLGANGHVTSKQSLDTATAGGRFIGESNRGHLGEIAIEQTADSTDGGYIRFATAASGSTSSTTHMTLASNGKLGLHSGLPDTQLHVKNEGGIELRLEADSNNNGQEDCFIRFYTDGKTQEGIAGMDNNNSSTLFSGNTENAMVFGTVSNLPVVFATNNTERVQITNDGSVGIGGVPGATFDVNNTTAADNRTVAIIEGKGNASSTADGGQYLSITRTGPISSSSGNVCGGILLANGSSITGQANCGIRGTYEYTNGRDLEFFTSADNSTAPTTKMQLKGNGNLALGDQIEPQGDSYLLSAYGTVVTCWFENRSTTAGHEVMILNRKESAGTMIAFAYNDSEKGTITQSGGTISYNAFMGSHYTESSEDVSTILLGTVMETVDALVENKYEDQKRLVKCKVSSTSESPNVYGVWIEDNETGQMAALGASWCRINGDVEVSMGDLLVSNGDGTAKVQSDDILRSKTIGKVTSTVKKETYSDGSYVVPVVLYCG